MREGLSGESTAGMVGEHHARPFASFRTEDTKRPGSLLSRPAVLLTTLYAVAICFERVVEVEVFKPYRIVGGVVILFALVRGRIVLDRITRLASLYVFVGILIGLLNLALRDDPVDEMRTAALIWMFNIAAYVAVISLLRYRDEILLVATAHAIGMAVATVDIAVHARELREAGAIARISGDFKNPANACLSILMATLIIITLLYRSEAGGILGFRNLFGTASAVGLLSGGLLVASFTGSRAGAALFLVGALVYLTFRTRRKLAFAAIGLLTGTVILMQFDALVPTKDTNVLVRRVQSKGLDTSRTYLWLAGFDAFVDTYGLGLGLAQYRNVHQQYFAPYVWKSDPAWADYRLTLHSDYASALIEHGVVGAVIFILLLRQIWRNARQIGSRSVRSLAAALIAAAAVEGLTHSVLPYFGLWFYLALLSAWLRAEQSEVDLLTEAKLL